MNINQINFADASLKKIEIEYNKIILKILLDNDQKIEIECNNIVGMDNLCLWDENILESIKVFPASKDNAFIKKIMQNYDNDALYDNGKSLKNEIYDIQIKFNFLADLVAHIYCQDYTINEK